MPSEALRSAGAATAERTALESALMASMDRAVRMFLVGVEQDAMVGWDSAVVVASATEPFTLGAVLGRWGRVVDAVVKRTARHLGVSRDAITSDPYLRSIDARLRAARMPMATYEETRAVLVDAVTSTAADQPSVARRLFEALSREKALARANQIARTEATAVYGHTQLRALAEAGHLSKKWVSHHDAATRPEHARADGQVVALSSPFLVGGYAMMVPGDPAAPLEQTAGCRCVIIAGDTTSTQVASEPGGTP